MHLFFYNILSHNTHAHKWTHTHNTCDIVLYFLIYKRVTTLHVFWCDLDILLYCLYFPISMCSSETILVDFFDLKNKCLIIIFISLEVIAFFMWLFSITCLFSLFPPLLFVYVMMAYATSCMSHRHFPPLSQFVNHEIQDCHNNPRVWSQHPCM